MRLSTPPDSLDEAYVVGSTFDYSNPNSGTFCFVISTKRLVSSPGNKCIHVDTTYKVTWHGFPTTVLGFSDKTDDSI